MRWAFKICSEAEGGSDCVCTELCAIEPRFEWRRLVRELTHSPLRECGTQSNLVSR